MCSILFSTKNEDKFNDDVNYYLKFRGPDHTEKLTYKDSLFVHNLLSITGTFTPQPFKSDDIVLIYNGEIYNYKEFGDYKTDGECLIPLYKKYGSSFTEKLDGEFALCLVDFKENKVVVSSDLFKTKPLFVGLEEGNIGCATYSSPLSQLGFKNVFKAKPNTTYTYNLQGDLLDEKEIYSFDLNQHKNTYDDWINAFTNSIFKRSNTLNKMPFIGLSSGYDSGLIFSEMCKQDREFYALCLMGTEVESIVNGRLSMSSDKVHSYQFQKDNNMYAQYNSYITKTTEPFYYTIHSDTSNYNEYNTLLTKDWGSNWYAILCNIAKNFDCKVCLSGGGADEIISDYGFGGVKKYQHSNFGGLFPKDLKSVFPWASFYGSTMESYIAKEEYVGGSFGIEVRYPFLDKQVVQEYLWLSQDLKNKVYKAPIDYYFNQNNIPYEKDKKRGF